MSDTIFGKIIRGEIPSDFLYQDEHCIAINDVNPQAPVHVLVIPKGEYTNILQFDQNASDDEKLGFLDAISQTAEIMGVDESGFRLVSNTGRDGGQTVAHLHVHLMGGELRW